MLFQGDCRLWRNGVLSFQSLNTIAFFDASLTRFLCPCSILFPVPIKPIPEAISLAHFLCYTKKENITQRPTPFNFDRLNRTIAGLIPSTSSVLQPYASLLSNPLTMA